MQQHNDEFPEPAAANATQTPASLEWLATLRLEQRARLETLAQVPPLQVVQFPVLTPVEAQAHDIEIQQETQRALSNTEFMVRGGGDVVLSSSGGNRTSQLNPPHFSSQQRRFQFNLDFFVTENAFDIWGDVVMHAIAT